MLKELQSIASNFAYCTYTGRVVQNEPGTHEQLILKNGLGKDSSKQNPEVNKREMPKPLMISKRMSRMWVMRRFHSSVSGNLCEGQSKASD